MMLNELVRVIQLMLGHSNLSTAPPVRLFHIVLCGTVWSSTWLAMDYPHLIAANYGKLLFLAPRTKK